MKNFLKMSMKCVCYIIMLEIALITISCKRDQRCNLNIVSADMLSKKYLADIAKRYNQSSTLDSSYCFEGDDLYIELLLFSDHSYRLNYSGWNKFTQLGYWNTQNGFLYLKRYNYQSYFKYVNIENSKTSMLIVRDIETKRNIPASYKIRYFGGNKDGILDSMINLPKSTNYIELEIPGNRKIGFWVKDIQGKRIEVYTIDRDTYLMNDSFKILPNELFLNNEVFFKNEFNIIKD
jgi:hypothetical protein